MSDALDLHPTLVRPDWPAPDSVAACVTTRETGPSQDAFAAFNPAQHVGDNPNHVSLCRRQLNKVIGDDRPLLWLTQVHGGRVQQHFADDAPEADAAVAGIETMPAWYSPPIVCRCSSVIVRGSG